MKDKLLGGTKLKRDKHGRAFMKHAGVWQQTQVRIDAELHRLLRLATYHLNVSMNHAINEAIFQWLEYATWLIEEKAKGDKVAEALVADLKKASTSKVLPFKRKGVKK